MSPLYSVIHRDITLAMRQKADIFQPLTFFVLVPYLISNRRGSGT